MNQIEQKISSRKVATMMEIRHSDLLEKIDKINEDLVTENSVAKYWTESTFKNRGKQYREFQVTKRGCEFLAHKATGTRGNLFTDRYMDAFENMKEVIKKSVISISKDDKDKIKLMNARSRMANTYMRLANVDTLSKEYKNILVAKASHVLAGEEIIPLPKLTQRTMTAGEIGKELGITSNKVGRIANENNLKQDGIYGEYRRDKSKHSPKEVDTFVYYPCVLEKFKELI